MRSACTIIVFWVLVIQAGYGQPYNNELHLGYGFVSDVEIIARFAGTYSKIASGISGDPVSSEYSTSGAFILGYNFFVSPKVNIGPELNVVTVTIRERYSSGEQVNDRFLFTNLSARFDYRYVRRENLQMYSGLALGGSYISDRSNDPSRDDRSGAFISYQLNFFGIRFGGEWGGYAELGFGRNGLLNAGISKQL